MDRSLREKFSRIEEEIDNTLVLIVPDIHKFLKYIVTHLGKALGVY